MAEPSIAPIPSEDIGEDKRFKKLPHHDVLMKPPFTCAVLGAIGADQYPILALHPDGRI